MDPCSSGTNADETFLGLALAEADEAWRHGDVPVGCVIVDQDGTVLGRGHNRREVDGDPTAHAEIIAIRAAARVRCHWRLDNTTLYVTLEPCAMCAGAIVNARIARVVFGCTDPKAGAVETLYSIATDPRLNHRARVQGGILRESCARRLSEFFQSLRSEGKK